MIVCRQPFCGIDFVTGADLCLLVHTNETVIGELPEDARPCRQALDKNVLPEALCGILKLSMGYLVRGALARVLCRKVCKQDVLEVVCGILIFRHGRPPCVCVCVWVGGGHGASMIVCRQPFCGIDFVTGADLCLLVHTNETVIGELPEDARPCRQALDKNVLPEALCGILKLSMGYLVRGALARVLCRKVCKQDVLEVVCGILIFRHGRPPCVCVCVCGWVGGTALR